jgi:hypothetical protein
VAGLAEVDGGKVRLHLHPGQQRAWASERQVVAVIAGTQSGKTVFGPPWLWREIGRRGPGDYLVAAPTYPLLELKALPEFLDLFESRLRLGKYSGVAVRRFIFSADGARATFGDRFDPDVPTRVYFGHASDPDSLEALTGKAAWLDEAGQKAFRVGSYEAVQRRMSIHQGRILITTTPYDLGWLKQRIYDPWQAGDGRIDVIRFESVENPAFPRAEFDRARLEMPRWRFDLFYRAIFTRPAGLIYDSFDPKLHVSPRFNVPADWRRYLGLDFGGVNTAGVFFAQEPGTGRLFAYREYKAGGRTAKDHARALLAGETRLPICVGGSKSEGQWRDEFGAGGMPVIEPQISDVEVGINRVYGAHARNEITVFADLAGYLDEKAAYRREVDAAGNPTEAIEDKNTFHFMDAERYIVGWLRPGADGGLPHTRSAPGTPSFQRPQSSSPFGSRPTFSRGIR